MAGMNTRSGERPPAPTGARMALIQGMVNYLEWVGGPVREFRGRLRLPLEGPLDPDLPIGLDYLLEAYHHLHGVSADPAFALKLGRSRLALAPTVFEYVALSSETMGECFQTLRRYFRVMSSGLVLDQEEGVGESALVLRPPAPAAQIPEWSWIAERVFGSLTFLIEESTLGAPRPRRVELDYAPVAHAAAYRELLGAEAVFRTGRCALVYGSEQLCLPMLARNARLREILLREAEAAAKGGDILEPRLRAVLEELINGGTPSAAQAARKIGVSVRTLHRRLKEEGLQFQSLVDDVRKQRCLSLISDRSVSLEEVAFLCGFAEASGFYRAFRRWTNEAPGDFRRKGIGMASRTAGLDGGSSTSSRN